MQTETLLGYIKSLLGQYKLYVILLCLIGISAAFFSVYLNYQIKEIIDKIAANPSLPVMPMIITFVICRLLYHGMFFFNRVVGTIYAPRISEQNLKYIYEKAMNHSLHWFDSNLSGESASKIDDFQQAFIGIIESFFTVLLNFSLITISLFFLFQIHMLSAVIILSFVLLYTPILYVLLKKQRILQKDYMNARQKTGGVVNDSISNAFGIKVIGTIKKEMSYSFFPVLKKMINCMKRNRSFDTYAIDGTDTIIAIIMSSFLVYFTTTLYSEGAISAGAFAFIAVTSIQIHKQINEFLDYIIFNINPLSAMLQVSYEHFNKDKTVRDIEGAKKLPYKNGDIKYDDVTFAYNQKSKSILKNFDLTIPQGQHIGIVETTGAGKTTLMKSLLRYFDINSGSITINGYKTNEVTQESLRAIMSVIPQDITMFHRSIKANLKLAKYDASDEEIISACKKAKIHDDIMEMPEGYDTIVGERGVKVSGGQRQRISIARAILKDAPILILDEATSSLDTETEQLIQESLNELFLNKKITVIAIAHRLSTLKHMDRIIVIDKGKIKEEGTHNSLIRKQGGMYKKLWEMQAI